MGNCHATFDLAFLFEESQGFPPRNGSNISEQPEKIIDPHSFITCILFLHATILSLNYFNKCHTIGMISEEGKVGR